MISQKLQELHLCFAKTENVKRAKHCVLFTYRNSQQGVSISKKALGAGNVGR